MPFYDKFISIEQFIPDPKSFDPERDLVQIEFETQRMYASMLRGQWSVAQEDALMSASMVEHLALPPYNSQRAKGIKLDKAMVGAPALFGVLGHDWKRIWKSQEPVTELMPVRRTTRLRKSTVILLKNR